MSSSFHTMSKGCMLNVLDVVEPTVPVKIQTQNRHWSQACLCVQLCMSPVWNLILECHQACDAFIFVAQKSNQTLIQWSLLQWSLLLKVRYFLFIFFYALYNAVFMKQKSCKTRAPTINYHKVRSYAAALSTVKQGMFWGFLLLSNRTNLAQIMLQAPAR